MPLVPIQIQPGLVTEQSDLTAGTRWTDGDKIRFRAGQPEKLKGWIKPTTDTFIGVCRDLIGWAAIDGIKYQALGTHNHLYILLGGTFNDITPLRTSGSLGTDPFTTTSASSTVAVNHTTHGVLVDDYVVFAGASAFNGVTIVGEYRVTAVTDANNYDIVDDETASASGAGGGASVTFEYLITSGTEINFAGLGWGAANWGEGTWGTPRASSDVTLEGRHWSLDVWGEDLIANVRGSDIYTWDTSVGVGTRAATITNSPQANFILISPTDRHLIAFGAEISGAIDPMLIAWSDQEDFTTWTPAATNTAGSLRLTDGSKIIGALRTRNGILVWTDTALYTMQFIGPSLTFGVKQIATGCGLIGPNAAVENAGVVYWMARETKQFYAFDGRLRVLQSPVLNHVQDDFTPDQADFTYAGTNREENEAWWFYTTDGKTQNDAYVVHNYGDDTWYFGTLDRSVFVDRDRALDTNPLATDFGGILYQHEEGLTNAGSALTSFVESGEFSLGPGEDLFFVDKFIPDFDPLVGQLTVSFKTRRYPTATEITKTVNILPATTKANLRARGRQMALRYESTGVEDDWRGGTPRINIVADGKR